jgi:2-hydroxycyclohexanecarboxyl-CoA dehydrogenase
VDLSRDVAIVTGAGRGLGRGIAEALAARGCRVVVAGNQPDLQEDVAAALPSGQAVACTVDVTRSDQVERLVDVTRAAFGPPTVLVNNAGADRIAPFLETDEDEWRATLDINLLSQMRCARAVLPDMVAAGYGRIINIASDAGRVGTSGQVAYSAAKGGVLGFTKALAREVARYGITVNCVAPGPANTPLLDEIVRGPHPRLLAAFERIIPLHRLAEPEDVAHVVLMLAAREAGYLTGQTVSVSGGLTMI